MRAGFTLAIAEYEKYGAYRRRVEAGELDALRANVKRIKG